MPPKPPQFFYRLKLLTLIILILLVFISLSAYSVNLYVSSQSIVRGGLAEFHYDAGDERVRVARLLLSGDSVTGVSVTCSKPRNSIGYFTVSVTFSNGVESATAQVRTYQGVGDGFTVDVYFQTPISYYPSPVLYAEVYKS
jgi:hypothetical protein